MADLVRYRVLKKCFVGDRMLDPRNPGEREVMAAPGLEGSALEPMDKNPATVEPIVAEIERMAGGAGASVSSSVDAGRLSIMIGKGAHSALAEVDQAAILVIPVADAVALIVGDLNDQIKAWPKADRITLA